MFMCSETYLVLLKVELAIKGAALRFGYGHGLVMSLDRQER